jgi:hypothetical protein
MRKIWLTLAAVFIVLASVFGVHQEAFVETLPEGMMPE